MRTTPPPSKPNFTMSVSLRCPQGTVLPTLPPLVLQGVAVSGERISRGPPGNVVALGCLPPPRRVSERSAQTTSCRFASSGHRSGRLYFIVPKKDGGLRPILDIRVLNNSVMQLKFKMLTLKQIVTHIRSEDWFVTIDLKDA